MTDLRDQTDLREIRISVSRKVDVHRAVAMEEMEEMAATESLDLVTETEDRAEETDVMEEMARTEALVISHVMADLSLTVTTETLVIRTLMREMESAI